MLKKYYYYFFLFTLTLILFYGGNFNTIIAGVAIFLIGMIFMEDGFKLFSGGLLERVLHISTDTLPKAIFTGIVTTSIVQSSSLISVIIISFLSAKLITLSGAIGVIFGSNIGTTTTAWIVSSLGIQIDIATYAMPMIIFGTAFIFSDLKSHKGIAKILLGIGFIFLGIDYMKEGFEVLESRFELSKYAMDGYLGAFIYISFGVIATVIMQSSSAMMALVITAVATNQIFFINAIELAIGANIGTTITAILGSLSSNSNGKRVALAHFIFNVITATVAIIFLYQFMDFTTFLASKIGIAEDDYGMKLALFHTLFNTIGVILISPFTKQLVKFLEIFFLEADKDLLKPLYLDGIVINIPDAAIESIKKETIHLYDSAIEAISHSMFLHRHNFIKNPDFERGVENIDISMDADINEFYTNKAKFLYGEIIHYATLSQEHMNQLDQERVYNLKLASRDIIEAMKDMRDLQKNIYYYSKARNSYIKEEYYNIRIYIAKTINTIEKLKEHTDDLDVITSIELLKESIKSLENIKNSRIDKLIRENKIDSKMATSLINDSAFAYEVSQKLIHAATILWIKDIDIRELGVQK